MAPGTRLLADVRPLRESTAFRRLWAGTTVSSVGSSPTKALQGAGPVLQGGVGPAWRRMIETVQ